MLSLHSTSLEPLYPVGLCFTQLSSPRSLHSHAGGNLASWLSMPHNSVCLGASGAVFGLFAVAVLLKISLKFTKLLEMCILGQFVVQQVYRVSWPAASSSSTYLQLGSLGFRTAGSCHSLPLPLPLQAAPGLPAALLGSTHVLQGVIVSACGACCAFIVQQHGCCTTVCCTTYCPHAGSCPCTAEHGQPQPGHLLIVGMQELQDVIVRTGSAVGGTQVAHIAHLGGALMGVLLVVILSRLPKAPTRDNTPLQPNSPA